MDKIDFFFFHSISVGLEPINGYQESNKNTSPLDNKLQSETNDAEIPMDIDTEPQPTDGDNSTNDPSSVTQVDLENELREFLESDTGLSSAADDVNSIDQMLMV